MPADPIRAKDMLFTTDYPIDQIVFMKENSFSVPDATASGFHDIAHFLPFVPLPMLVWSNTPDFLVSYISGDLQYISGDFDPVTTLPLGQNYVIGADATTIHISLYNRSGSTQTVYYRVFCLMPSWASEDSLVPFTANQGDDFILSTDYNYMKLFKASNLAFQTPPALVSYNHNLGYVPRAFIWGVETGQSAAYPLVIAQVFPTVPNSTTGVYLDTTSITWQNPSGWESIEYRLYLDEGT